MPEEEAGVREHTQASQQDLDEDGRDHHPGPDDERPSRHLSHVLSFVQTACGPGRLISMPTLTARTSARNAIGAPTSRRVGARGLATALASVNPATTRPSVRSSQPLSSATTS